MNAVEFCYWLQGYFELRESDRPLSDKQIKIIAVHLRMVDLHDKSDGRSRQFCQYLSNAVSAFGEVQLSASQTQQVRKLLSEVFVHEIDPSYPSDEIEELQKIHNGGSPVEEGFHWNYAPGEKC